MYLAEVAEECGISFRQANHWTSAGWLGEWTRSGTPHNVTREQRRKLALAADLVLIGFQPRKACAMSVALSALSLSSGDIKLGRGYVLRLPVNGAYPPLVPEPVTAVEGASV